MPNDPYQTIVEEYRQHGYDRVHVHHEVSGFRYHRHFHPHDLTLKVLEGDLEVTVGNTKHQLAVGQTIDIPVGRLHATCMGPQGCVYVHAEKHYPPNSKTG